MSESLSSSLPAVETEKRIFAHVVHAREKHPKFAPDVETAFCHLAEEFGEVAMEVSKGYTGWRHRLEYELLDLIAVAIRMLEGDYE